MRHQLNNTAMVLLTLTLLVGCTTQSRIIEQSEAAPIPPRGLSASGIDYGVWVGSTDYEYAPEDHPFHVSVSTLRANDGDDALVAALRSDGFTCESLVSSEESQMWRCTHAVIDDFPMSSSWVTRWTVAFWEREMLIEHSGGVVLWY